MSQYPCLAGCGTPTAAFLCGRCLGELHAALRELVTDGRGGPGLLAELDVTLSRQDVLSAGTAAGAHAAAPLPYRPEASALSDVAGNLVTTWARDLAEHNPHLLPPAGTVTDAAVWLAELPAAALARHPAAGELHQDIRELVARLRWCIDRRPDAVYAGPCGARVDGGWCGGHLYARVAAPSVRCPQCGARHDVAERRDWMLRQALDELVIAPVALGWTRLLLDQVIPDGTWRSWVSRGRILAKGRDRFGRPRYRFGDVHALVTDYIRRRHAA